MSNRSRFLTFGLPLVGVASLVGGGVLVAENRPTTAAEQPPRTPIAAPGYNLTDASRFIGALGLSEPPGEPILVASHIAGVVAKVLVSPGDAVSVGTPLFELDDRQAQSTVEVRRARLDVAIAEVESLRAEVPPARARVAAAEATVASAKANVRAAAADLADRRNRLRIAQAIDDPRAISAEEIDLRRFAAEQAEARLSIAEALELEAHASRTDADAELSRLIDPSTSSDGPDLLAAVLRVEQARRDLMAAMTDLELLTVTSSIDGRVLQVNLRPGEFAPAGAVAEGLIVLGRAGNARLRVDIDEVDIPRFDSAAAAWASPRGDATRRLSLSLDYVEPLVVPKRNLAGRTNELIDTRVLQAVYALPDTEAYAGLGQQYDVFIEAREVTP